MTRLLLAAAVVVAWIAAAGVGGGAEWDVYLGAGTPIQDTIDGAGAGIRFTCMRGSMWKIWTWTSGLH